MRRTPISNSSNVVEDRKRFPRQCWTANRSPLDWPCHLPPCAVRRQRWYQAKSSRQVCCLCQWTQFRRLKRDVSKPRHGQSLDDVSMLAGKAPVLFKAEQHMGRRTPVRDENWTGGCFFGSAGVLVALPAGQRCDGHSSPPGGVSVKMLLQCRMRHARRGWVNRWTFIEGEEVEGGGLGVLEVEQVGV